MKVKVLASGSKGNVTYIEDENTKILIDIGMRSCYVEKELKKFGIEPKQIDAILITHTHKDHTLGIHTFTKKYNTPTYISSKMSEEIDSSNQIFIRKEMNIKDINVKVIRTSHDVESYGYIINDELVYITDTGYINEKYFDMLKDKKIYIMESNHDIEMLETGPYPYHLKQRIWSSKGHMSNKMCAEYLNKFITNKTKCVILAHLSETNNLEELALKEYMSKENNRKVKKVIVAKPQEATELVEI